MCNLNVERTKRSEAEKWCCTRMSRSYWERWHWELERKKEYLVQEKRLHRQQSGSSATEIAKVHEIHPDLLQNESACEVYVGRGSFGVVRSQIYRRMRVAVKELLPNTQFRCFQRSNDSCSFVIHMCLICLVQLRPYYLIEL